ncbi:hypothetical protein FACS1894188_12110 [Clostridia bacterium]|nr:hypothetical protein FACS1894188_12110 [Clostridia bacterium]
MSSKIFRTLCVLLAAALLSSGFTVVSAPDYRNITGVTREEIDAIDALCENRAYFSYGAVYSSEIFLDDNGDIDTSGFTPLFCVWLTDMFQIPFVPQIYAQNELSAELSANEIDFTGELTATEELKKHTI